jgi:predicted DNA-binding protein
MRKEVAMSELTLVAEDILKAIHAMEDAYNATQELRENTNHVTFDEFRTRMLELHDRLEKLKTVLDNEEAYVVDELADALSMANTGHRLEYRRTPRMHD